MNKFIVITSINPPSEAVGKFASMKDYQLIVVGDKKTPADWNCENVTYLSVEKQAKLGYRIQDKLPYNHYNRKMLGYLYAIQQGADIIVDSDDDNIPYDDWRYPEFEGIYYTSADDIGFDNVFKCFTTVNIWPRGFPLQYILNHNHNHYSRQENKVGIWSGLVNGDTDVDAIYRLTNNKPIFFEGKSEVVLGKNSVCPFNSQNTIWRKELFPLLYLTTFVPARANDIFRSLIAQPIMWLYGYRMGFTPPTAVQVRNPHNYLKDFEDELPCYLYSEKVFELAKRTAMASDSITGNLVRIYAVLSHEGIVKTEELELLKDWLRSLKEAGYGYDF